MKFPSGSNVAAQNIAENFSKLFLSLRECERENFSCIFRRMVVRHAWEKILLVLNGDDCILCVILRHVIVVVIRLLLFAVLDWVKQK